MNDFLATFDKKYQESEMILIGLGEELNSTKLDEVQNRQRTELFNFLYPYLERKNYFIISSETVKSTGNTGIFNTERITMPLLLDENQEKTNLDDNDDDNDMRTKQWNRYNQWLSCTLNKSILLIELGEGFSNPNLFRWPFEKVTFINQKSFLYRVHSSFSQIPDGIQSRSTSVPMNAFAFLSELKTYLETKM